MILSCVICPTQYGKTQIAINMMNNEIRRYRKKGKKNSTDNNDDEYDIKSYSIYDEIKRNGR